MLDFVLNAPPKKKLGLRNVLVDWSMPEASNPLDRVRDADAILTHEFGDQENVSRATEAIVHHAVRLAKLCDKELICQSPGDVVAAELGLTPAAIIRKHRLRPGAYLDTEEVNRQAAELCFRYGWENLVVMTHHHHLWRACSNLKHHGIRPVPLALEAKRIPYDSECRRLAIRSPLVFLPREVCARLEYYRRGWLA